MIDGKRNPLYAWWADQKRRYKNGDLSKVILDSFINVGIDLSNLNSGGRDGFTKWANRVSEIADFISENGHYPKAGKDKVQSKLYQSLARSKRAFNNNELSSKQLKFLNELDIDLSNLNKK